MLVLIVIVNVPYCVFLRIDLGFLFLYFGYVRKTKFVLNL